MSQWLSDRQADPVAWAHLGPHGRASALVAGQYSLTVTVTDVQSNRIAETRVPVEVVQ